MIDPLTLTQVMAAASERSRTTDAVLDLESKSVDGNATLALENLKVEQLRSLAHFFDLAPGQKSKQLLVDL
jgi:hypothetical protein